jgi:hypothetical protein
LIFSIKKTLLFSFFVSTTVIASTIEQQKADDSINEYSSNLLSKEKIGGFLYCEKDTEGKRIEFKSCQKFSELIHMGCFGNSTYEAGVEIRYSDMCAELQTIKKATSPRLSYFNLKSPSWWKSIPAEVIPMSGGIYSDEGWMIAKSERESLVAGKTLGDFKLQNMDTKEGGLEVVLSKITQECGIINDTLKFSVALVADFDNDGVAELLLEGYRVDKSDTCSLGSGNSLGASFSALVKKVNQKAVPIVLSYPLTEK